VLTTLKGTLPAPGIGFVLDDLLANRCGCSPEELDDACVELEQPKRGEEGLGWIVRERGVVWLVNGLKFEPSIRASDPKHRAHVAEWLAQFGGDQSPLRIVRLFHKHYPEWFVDSASGPTGMVASESPPEPRTKPRRPSSKGPKKGSIEGASQGSDKGSFQGSLLAQHNTTHHNTTEKTTTWLTPYLNHWQKQYGTQVSSPGKLARFLRPVHDLLGPDECLARWGRYLANCPVEKASDARFSETHTGYATASVAGSKPASVSSNGARYPSATDALQV
jgi:hypothetical protein